LLSKHGIPVHILEASDHLDQQPRAAHYGTPAIPDLLKTGILEEVRRRGLVLNTMCWRRFDDHSYIAGFDAKVLQDVDGQDLRTTCLVLQDLDQLMLDTALEKYGATISWQHKVVGIGQDDDKAWVDVETPEGKVKVEGDYIVGCDGANSQIRKSLFGDDYPGFTWDAQIIATNVSAIYIFTFRIGLKPVQGRLHY
jgi:2-polyprenyl-6-methoxyphenol hydroxylase-like FAD-dependent oxidoreductase